LGILGCQGGSLELCSLSFLLCVERGRYRAATTAAAGAVFLPADPPCAPAPSEGFERAWAPGPALDRTGKESYMFSLGARDVPVTTSDILGILGCQGGSLELCTLCFL